MTITDSRNLATIVGLGTAVPNPLSQSDSADFAKPYCCASAKEEKVLEKLYAHTAISKRSSSLLLDPTNESGGTFYSIRTSINDKGPSTRARMEAYQDCALRLALNSTTAALQDACVEPDEITHLVTVSCTGFSAPGFDINLIRTLELSPHVQRTHVGFMGCHGAINGLRAAAAIAASQPNSTVLLCATEVCTLHFQYGWSSDSLVANSLFSDGSASAVLRQRVIGATSSEGAGNLVSRQETLRVIGSGSYLIPDSLDAMQWQIGDHGFTMRLSPDVPNLVRDSLADWLIPWLAKYSMALEDVGGWAIHPGGPRLLNAVQTALSLSPAQLYPSFSVLKDFGNMSSPTVLFILRRLLMGAGAPPYVLLAFGPGLTIEALLLG